MSVKNNKIMTVALKRETVYYAFKISFETLKEVYEALKKFGCSNVIFEFNKNGKYILTWCFDNKGNSVNDIFNKYFIFEVKKWKDESGNERESIEEFAFKEEKDFVREYDILE